MRLQRISQNSLVFITFPSNKVKRPEHSLGVMHIASKMLRSALINTEYAILEKMFLSLKSEIDTWARKDGANRPAPLDAYPSSCFNISGDDGLYLKKATKLPRSSLDGNAFFNMLIPNNVPDKYYVLCTTLFQGVRLAGLLHDLGHLPYSHTVEVVIKTLNSLVRDKSDKTNLEEEFTRLTQPYLEREQPLHEALSEAMIPVVEREVAETICKGTACADLSIYSLISMVAFRVAKDLLYNKESLTYKSFHSIISGIVDADRLDYASRDLYCAAVSHDIINYDRMFLHCAIREGIDDEHSNNHSIVFDIKATREIEEFLRRRWRIYRDINFHHSVHKSELIMRRALVSKALETWSLPKSFDAIVEEYDNRLPDDFILGIILILVHLKEDGNHPNVRKLLLMLDDSWLDALLKRSDNSTDNDDELIFGRKKYKTIIKRFDDFVDFDQKVFNSFCIEIPELLSIAEKVQNSNKEVAVGVDDNSYIVENEFFDDLCESLKEFNSKIINEDGDEINAVDHRTYMFYYEKLFTNFLLDVLLNSFASDADLIDKDPLGLFINQIENDNIFKNDSVFLGANDFNTGIPDESEYKVWRAKNNSLVNFRFYSSISDDLTYEKQLFPSFHLYATDDTDDKTCLDMLSCEFVRFAATHIKTYFNNCLLTEPPLLSENR
jgi:HD superfamily phosphohydrolase